MNALENAPTEVIISHLRQLAQPYTVHRRDGTTDSSQYGSSPSYSKLGSRDCYLFYTTVRSERTAAGERPQTAIQGYALIDVDIQENDRIDFDGRRYELEIPEPIPSHDPEILRLDGEYVKDVP